MTTPTNVSSSPRLLMTYLWAIVAVAVATTIVAVGVTSSRAPVYSATGSVLVKPDTSGGAAVLPQMGTERAVASSDAVADLAAERLNLSPETASAHLSASVPVDTDVVELTYTAPTASDARAGARAFTSAYVEYRNLDLKTPLAQVIGWPQLPAAATPPNYPVVGTLGLLVGLALGVAAAFVWDRLRGRLRGPGDAARATGAEVLASIPARAQVADPVQLSAAERELFGHLAARVTGELGTRRRGASVLVTGPRRVTGTTTVATDLAVALAGLGRDVVLVSGDVTRAQAHLALRLARTPGLTDVLRGRFDLQEALQYTPVPNLRVLTAGDAPMSGGDVDDVRAVVAQLARDALVIVDAPPILETPETTLIGEGCDVVLLVLDLRAGSRADAAAAAAVVRRLPGSFLGVVTDRPTPSRRRGPESGGQPPLTPGGWTSGAEPAAKDVVRDVAPHARR